MDLQIKDKRVLVSGSTAGIGLATAKLFANEGCHVFINGRSDESIERAIRSLQDENPRARLKGAKADFGQIEQINALISEIGDLDILVNNVGIYASKTIRETTDKEWLDMFNINVLSGVRLSRAFLPNMLEKGWGRIVFVSSECATVVPSDLIAYSATKAAMHAVSRGLAQLCRSTNVTVNTVMPGSTMTEGAVSFLEGVAAAEKISLAEAEDNFFKDVRTSSLVQRFLKPKEIASSIVYLCSNLASASNGSTMKLEGGSTGGIL